MNFRSAPPAAALVADAIARIEERRDALDRLAAKGMDMLERIAAGETVELAGRKPFANSARAFAVVSRAVRLCLALASRLDEVLIDLPRGGPIPDLAILAPELVLAAGPRIAAPKAETAPQMPAVIGTKARIARAVDAVIEAEVGDHDGSERMRAYVDERLIEGEDYDRMLHRPWREVVQTICADLGLHHDWTAWDNNASFLSSRPLGEELSKLRAVRPPKLAMAVSRETGPPGPGSLNAVTP